VDITVSIDDRVMVCVADDKSYTPEVIGDWLTRAVAAAVSAYQQMDADITDEDVEGVNQTLEP
jgi:hypothetical protein